MRRIAIILVSVLFLSLDRAQEPVPINRVFGSIELGEFVDRKDVSSTFNLPDYYALDHYREFSSYSFRTPVKYFDRVWDEVLVDYQNDTHNCSALFFYKVFKQEEKPFKEYDSLKQWFVSLYGSGEEKSSGDGRSITCIWQDSETVLTLMLSKISPGTRHRIMVSFSDKHKDIY